MPVHKVPRFVKARTPEMLIRQMIRNNQRSGIEFKYFDIQKQDGSWFAWYLADVSEIKKQVLSEAMNNGNE